MATKRVKVECACNNYLDKETPCCDFFKKMLNDCGVRLGYLKHDDMYTIRIIGSDSHQVIKYCPWCGVCIYPQKSSD
jgi:hypothetical protein